MDSSRGIPPIERISLLASLSDDSMTRHQTTFHSSLTPSPCNKLQPTNDIIYAEHSACTCSCLSVCQLIKLSCLPRINLWSQVRYDYDTTTTRLEYDTRKLRVCYECRWGGVRHLCDKMALNINFTNQTTNISKTNYRKQAAKRHTRRSYGLDRYVTCR